MNSFKCITRTLHCCRGNIWELEKYLLLFRKDIDFLELFYGKVLWFSKHSYNNVSLHVSGDQPFSTDEKVGLK